MPLMRKIDYFLEGLLHFPFLRFGRMTLHPKYEWKKKKYLPTLGLKKLTLH